MIEQDADQADESLDQVVISHGEAILDLPLVKAILAASIPSGRVVELVVTHAGDCCGDPRPVAALLGVVQGEVFDEDAVLRELAAALADDDLFGTAVPNNPDDDPKPRRTVATWQPRL